MKRFLLFASALCLSAHVINAQDAADERDFQISFITPIGTNGMESCDMTNKFSVNILGGHSAANRIFEFGSIYNVNTVYTKGVQLSGVMNYTGESRYAVQFAGVANVANRGESPFQGAGVANIADEVEGMQAAGVVNVADEVEGVQAAGVVNVADEVDGVQLGLINIANRYDDGAPIGLINIVKEGGKQEFELSFSEVLNMIVSFRLGTDRFYTIFSGGVNCVQYPTESPLIDFSNVEYAVGLGFGTHFDWTRGWGNEIEAMCYSVTDDGVFTDELNLLTQLKFTVSKDFSRNFGIFAGPVLNMTISDYRNSPIAPWSAWEADSDENRLNSWVGLVAGFRF